MNMKLVFFKTHGWRGDIGDPCSFGGKFIYKKASTTAITASKGAGPTGYNVSVIATKTLNDAQITRNWSRGPKYLAGQSFAFHPVNNDGLIAPGIARLAKGRISQRKDLHGTWSVDAQANRICSGCVTGWRNHKEVVFHRLPELPIGRERPGIVF